MQARPLVIVQIVPVGCNQLDLGTLRKIGRLIHDQATAPHVTFQANHDIERTVALGRAARRRVAGSRLSAPTLFWSRDGRRSRPPLASAPAALAVVSAVPRAR